MITINVDKAKTVAHAIRRTAREEEFKPHDEIIMKRIPGKSYDDAEAERQAIRDKYATMQEQIDSAADLDDIKTALGSAL
jgi:hypothetical protein